MYTSHRYVKTVVVKHYLWIMVPSIKAISGMYKIEWTVGMITATFNCYHLMSVLNRSQKNCDLSYFLKFANCCTLHTLVRNFHITQPTASSPRLKGTFPPPRSPAAPRAVGNPPPMGPRMILGSRPGPPDILSRKPTEAKGPNTGPSPGKKLVENCPRADDTRQNNRHVIRRFPMMP